MKYNNVNIELQKFTQRKALLTNSRFEQKFNVPWEMLIKLQYTVTINLVRPYFLFPSIQPLRRLNTIVNKTMHCLNENSVKYTVLYISYDIDCIN